MKEKKHKHSTETKANMFINYKNAWHTIQYNGIYYFHLVTNCATLGLKLPRILQIIILMLRLPFRTKTRPHLIPISILLPNVRMLNNSRACNKTFEVTVCIIRSLIAYLQ